MHCGTIPPQAEGIIPHNLLRCFGSGACPGISGPGLVLEYLVQGSKSALICPGVHTRDCKDNRPIEFEEFTKKT